MFSRVNRSKRTNPPCAAPPLSSFPMGKHSTPHKEAHRKVDFFSWVCLFQDTINKRYVSEQTYRMWPTLLFMEMYESNNFQQRNNNKSKYKQTILHKSSCDLYHVNWFMWHESCRNQVMVACNFSFTALPNCNWWRNLFFHNDQIIQLRLCGLD